MEGQQGDRNAKNFSVLRSHPRLFLHEEAHLQTLCQCFQFPLLNFQSSEWQRIQKQRKKSHEYFTHTEVILNTGKYFFVAVCSNKKIGTSSPCISSEQIIQTKIRDITAILKKNQSIIKTQNNYAR